MFQPARFRDHSGITDVYGKAMTLHTPIRLLVGFLCAAGLSQPVPAQSSDEEKRLEPMLAYLDFADYGGGVIFPEQIEAADYARFFIVDTRMATQFEAGTLPGAINIDWRQLLARRHVLPKDRPVLLYCHTGMLSAQAAFALRVAGWDNVRVLQGGYLEWVRKGGVDAARLAASKP